MIVRGICTGIVVGLLVLVGYVAIIANPIVQAQSPDREKGLVKQVADLEQQLATLQGQLTKLQNAFDAHKGEYDARMARYAYLFGPNTELLVTHIGVKNLNPQAELNKQWYLFQFCGPNGNPNTSIIRVGKVQSFLGMDAALGFEDKAP